MGPIAIPLLCLLGTLVLVVVSYRLQLWDHISNHCSNACFHSSVAFPSSKLGLSTFSSFLHYLCSEVVNSHLFYLLSQLVFPPILGFSCSSLLLSPLAYLVQFFGISFCNFDPSFLHSFFRTFSASPSFSSSHLHSLLNLH